MKKTKRLISFTILSVFVVMLFLCADFNFGSTKAESNPTYNLDNVESFNNNSYNDYIEKMTTKHKENHGDDTITPNEHLVIPGSEYYSPGTTIVNEESGNRIVTVVDKASDEAYSDAIQNKLLIHNDEGMVTYKIEIKKAGFYNINMRYYTIVGYSSSIERTFAINGKVPFEGTDSLTFSRVWQDHVDSYDKNGNLKEDLNKNQLKPKQVEVHTFRESYFKDYMGYNTDPYKYYFEEGTNYISLIAVKEPIMIDQLEILPVEELSSYDQYLADMHAQFGTENITNQAIKIQAEKTHSKSSPTLYPVADRSSSKTFPYSYTKTKLNSIGGDNWKVLGDWISWQIEVTEPGYYNISMRAKQNMVRGMYSSRILYVDGEVAFEECNDVQIPYGNKWQNITIGNEDGAYLFYLSKGVHTLTLEVTLGEYAPLIERIQTCIDGLSAIYRKVIAYTTVKPDEGRDYELNKKFPTLFQDLTNYANELDNISKTIQNISGGGSDKTGVIDSVVVQIRDILKDNLRSFPSRLSNFSTNVSSLGTLLNSLRELPLMIDYIEVHTPDVELERANENFLRGLWDGIVKFFCSFVIDYAAIGETVPSNGDEDRTIEVWMTQGRDQANVIRNLIDTDFKRKYPNIKVELKLTAADVLLKATLAGIGPNVALNVDSGLPVNYALRNAVLDLSEFIYEIDDNGAIVLDKNGNKVIKDSDFYILSNGERYDNKNPLIDAASNVYYETSINQFQFFYDTEDNRNGTTGTYALPEKQIFLMMFVRDDVMQELGLSDMIPETWGDVIDLIAELQTNQLQFYLPVNDAGATALNPIFVSLLSQNGGTLYTDNNKQVGLLSEPAMKSFETWTEFYTLYSFPKYASFVNRFRSGEMPIGIAYYELYNTLSVFAPELKGKWSFHVIPGVELEDGTVDHTAVASGTGCVILKDRALKDEQAKLDSWEFLKWWSSAETQTSFGREMEGILGSAARHATANVKALNSLAWPKADLNTLMEQWRQTCSIPQIAGSYITGREMENAYRQVINEFYNAREILYEYANKINVEIDRKREEFGLKLRDK